ncbi:class I SAM-dependent methyltransferase [archaeon]|jgi:ubiquinone/menaquinone biosynthesis C-methylase UbiE|nr:class I SAM-dependent methyltransferase [archaeon]
MKRQYDIIGKDYILGQERNPTKREGEALQFIKKNLPSLQEKVVLDVGCGHGKDIKMLEELGAKEVWGLDISKFMINEARKVVKNKNLLVIGDIADTSFPSDFFDVIISRFSLHYCREFKPAYAELARILKKGGKIIFTVHHPLRDLHLQKDQTYGKQEIVSINLYDSALIQVPTHRIKDYFSKAFFNNFTLVQYDEEVSPEEFLDEFNTPGWMGFKAIKN